MGSSVAHNAIAVLLQQAKTSLRRNKLHRPTKAGRSTAGATAPRVGVVEITAPSSPATIAGNLTIWLRSQASHATYLSLIVWSWYRARPRHMPCQFLEPGTMLKVSSWLARM
jgi:hypothetical protein